MCFFSDTQYYTVIAQELRSSPGLRGARDMSWLSSAMAMATDKVRAIGWDFTPLSRAKFNGYPGPAIWLEVGRARRKTPTIQMFP